MERLDINLHDSIITTTYFSNGQADCKIAPYTLQLSQVPKEREY